MDSKEIGALVRNLRKIGRNWQSMDTKDLDEQSIFRLTYAGLIECRMQIHALSLRKRREFNGTCVACGNYMFRLREILDPIVGSDCPLKDSPTEARLTNKGQNCQRAEIKQMRWFEHVDGWVRFDDRPVISDPLPSDALDEATATASISETQIHGPDIPVGSPADADGHPPKSDVPPDESAYVPISQKSTEYVGKRDCDRALKNVLIEWRSGETSGKIRWWKPSPRRFCVHSGDWDRYHNQQNENAFEALGESAESVDKYLHDTKTRQAKLRKNKRQK